MPSPSLIMRTLMSLLALAALAACGDDGTRPPSCDTEPPSCEASIPATYDAIYDQVLSRSCGASGSGGSCHGQDGAQGGLVLAEREGAYRQLLGDADGRERVVAGSAECSVLMRRLDSDDARQRMPLGAAKLSEGLRCAVSQWIAAGAER